MEKITIYEKIIKGEVPSYKIYEDDMFISFLDINPKSNGHALIIPKKRMSNILEDSILVRERILEVTKTVSKIIQKGLSNSSFKIVINCGEEAGQEVFHTHLHLIPYYKEKQDILSVDKIYKKLTVN